MRSLPFLLVALIIEGASMPEYKNITESTQDFNGNLSSQFEELEPTSSLQNLPLILITIIDSKQMKKSHNISALIQNNEEIILEKSTQRIGLTNQPIQLKKYIKIDEKQAFSSVPQVNNIIVINQTSNEQVNISNPMRVLNLNYGNNFTTKFVNKSSVDGLITKFSKCSTENFEKFQIEHNMHLKKIGNKTKKTDFLINNVNKTLEKILLTSKEVNNFTTYIVNKTITTENFYKILNTNEHSYEKVIEEPRKEISVKVALVSLSQIIKDQQTFNRTRMKINNINETLKSLGSVDLILPNFNDNSEVKNLNKSVSTSGEHIVSPARSDIQVLSRTDSPMLNYIFDTHANLNKHQHRNDRFGAPRIESSSSNITLDTEENANLDCRVSSLRDKLVSWVRRKGDDQIDILTIGLQAYTSDSRFSIDYLEPNIWRLVLRDAVSSDSGTYECQLSTHPPIISRHQLYVHAPEVGILEGVVDKYYEMNSTLELGCRVRHLTTTTVNWLHRDRVLNDDTERGGISVKIEAVPGGADSTLQVARLTSGDAGRYTCSVRKGLQAAVNVHVLNGSLAELQQTSGATDITSSLLDFIIRVITSSLADFIIRVIISSLWLSAN